MHGGMIAESSKLLVIFIYLLQCTLMYLLLITCIVLLDEKHGVKFTI